MDEPFEGDITGKIHSSVGSSICGPEDSFSESTEAIISVITDDVAQCGRGKDQAFRGFGNNYLTPTHPTYFSHFSGHGSTQIAFASVLPQPPFVTAAREH